MSATTIRIERAGPRADVVLARPAVRNAFNEIVVRELREAFEALGADPAVRVVVLRTRPTPAPWRRPSARSPPARST